MEQELECEVKVISNETIKPSLPPSSPPKTFSLSVLDQTFPAYHFPLLLFYTSNPPTPPPPQVDIACLKNSLSQTLDKFCPLAGRFLDNSTVSCNNEGVPFVHTNVNTHLSLVMNSPYKLKFLTKFLPPHELLALGPKPVTELVPLSFQINGFLCGGVVIGCYILHKLLDTTSLATFLNYWACLASRRFDDLIQPDFDITINAFPPLSRLENVLVPSPHKYNPSTKNPEPTILAKSFIFSSVSLSNLKAKAASESNPQPTRFEALAGFIWEQALTASYVATNVKVENTKVGLSVNIRQRMSKPFPKESIGNLITYVYTQADATTSKMQDFVKEIHLALLSKSKEKITQIFESKDRAELICQDWMLEMEAATTFQEGLYKISSWCNTGVSDVDFGFGKPVWIVPTYGDVLPPPIQNHIFFMDRSDGIEVWLFLDKKEMEIIESNPHFLSFASPN